MPVNDEELSAFADGALPRGKARRVAGEIRAHPEYADRIHDYWRREAALRQALSPYLSSGPVRPASGQRTRWRWLGGSAAALILAVALGVGYRVHQTQNQPNFTDLVLHAYFNNAGGSSSLSPPPPLFVDLGLEPEKRQQLTLAGQQIMEYRYSDPDGDGVALYEMDSGTAVHDGWFHVMSRKRVPLVRWAQGGKTYVLIGDNTTPALTRLALEIRERILGQTEQARSGQAANPAPGADTEGPTSM